MLWDNYNLKGKYNMSVYFNEKYYMTVSKWHMWNCRSLQKMTAFLGSIFKEQPEGKEGSNYANYAKKNIGKRLEKGNKIAGTRTACVKVQKLKGT